MSKQYTQLTEAERYHRYTMKKQGYTDTVIAQGMDRDRTTFWRELHRNTGQGSCCPSLMISLSPARATASNITWIIRSCLPLLSGVAQAGYREG